MARAAGLHPTRWRPKAAGENAGIFNKVGGSLLIGAGVAAATIRAGQG